ncbi:MAG: EAL domain-containing protein [Gammaproteobacteria bacterium]|nr:EAL domain-containing protein [Gammaproteobacteria bacterium]
MTEASLQLSSDKLSHALSACTDKYALAMVHLSNLDELSALCGISNKEKIIEIFSTSASSILRPQDSLVVICEERLALIMDNLLDKNHAELAGLKLQRIFERNGLLDTHSIKLDVHCGIVYAGRNVQQRPDVDELYQQAETALDTAVANHESFTILTLEDEQVVDNHWQLNLRVKDAMQAHNISMDYQPKVYMHNGELAGAEALVRWRDNGVIIPPNDYITALSDDVLWDLTIYCYRRVLREIVDFELTVPISVNIDPSSLAQDDFIEFIKRETNLWGVEPSQIILELTETRTLFDADDARERLIAISNLGFKISIDDFGSGHSNYERIRDLPVDEIKIDRSFCGNLIDNPDNTMLTRSIIDIAQALKAQTVAEGIEDAATLDLLREWGCDIGQGFYLGAPVSIEKFAALNS